MTSAVVLMTVLFAVRTTAGSEYGTSDRPKRAEFAAQCESDKYYKHVDAALAGGVQGEQLKQVVHDIIKAGHRAVPYTDHGSRDPNRDADAWKALEFLDQDPTDASMVRGVYSLSPRAKVDHGASSGWNREHTWPKSYGVDTTGADTSDLHALRACDWNTNSARNNKIYKDCEAAGTKGCESPAHAEATPDTAADNDLDYWLPPADLRGDLARGLFYMEFRYDGRDDPKSSNLTLAPCGELWTYFKGNPWLGDLKDLLTWHCEDPVSDEERKRNDDACVYWQGNRNPFVDRPQLVARYFGDAEVAFDRCRACVDAGADIADCDAFKLVDADKCDGPEHATAGTPITTATVARPSHTTNEEEQGSSQEAEPRNEDDQHQIPRDEIFINEFHYDNAGLDEAEAVEICAPSGTDLAGWSVVLYNGKDGREYDAVGITEQTSQVPGARGSVGFVSIPILGIQNGPDGIALVDPQGAVHQFLSYEGSFVATDGPAQGLRSTKVSVGQSNETPRGHSLQLTGGPGRSYSDFVWTGPSPRTFGAQNRGQTFIRASNEL